MWRRHMRGRLAEGQADGRAVVWIGGFWQVLTARLSVRPSARFLRQLAGMPDYAAHLEHLRRYHPERGVPSEREFFEDYLRSRYAEGPTRCC